MSIEKHQDDGVALVVEDISAYLIVFAQYLAISDKKNLIVIRSSWIFLVVLGLRVSSPEVL